MAISTWSTLYLETIVRHDYPVRPSPCAVQRGCSPSSPVKLWIPHHPAVVACDLAVPKLRESCSALSWAYHALGWGGYWAWDPVENASFLPWLSSTAFLHSVMMQEKKGMMKVWNIVLVSSSFFLCIFGTFLTRSGVVSSVHAFAQSPIGKYFVGFLSIGIALTIYAILDRLPFLKSESELESVVSRESSFLFNNLVLLSSCFAVLWGTLFPVISEAITNEKISLDKPWFDRLMIPIGLFLLFLTGVGPLFAWRRTSIDSLRRNFTVPGIVGIAVSGILFGNRYSSSLRTDFFRPVRLCHAYDCDGIL